MRGVKRYRPINVLRAAQERIAYSFDHFERVFISFSGGKDSSVMTHLVMQEAIRRKRKVGVLIVDMEAQYNNTIEHIQAMVDMYREHMYLHWVCLPLNLRNAVTNYEPQWQCWDPGKKDIWVRNPPEDAITDFDYYPFFVPGMEFEEFVPLWGLWFAGGRPTAGMIGIRADESLNRFRTVAIWDKGMHGGNRWTTLIGDELFNVYPIYDWKTEDIWRFHGKFPDLPHNKVYDLMNKAGVPLSQQRLCQPYGDDQRRGLWLYHILEPNTWFKLIARVNGVNHGAMYVQENGNIMGYHKITKPDNHTWKSFTNLLLMSLPKPTREHYIARFQGFIKGWRGRGYVEIPDEAPKVLEDKKWAPSWRRMAKVLLRNDYWCKGLGLTQPKSEAYGKYLDIKRARQLSESQHREAV
jgi:predicted phosphoadenosine phosphosulfate sulfurtransferase